MLPDFPDFMFFLISAMTLNIVPGADVLYVASQSLIAKKNGILAALGICTGMTMYMLATTFGLAEVLRYSPVTFNLIKIAGALYLAYLAWQAFSHSNEDINLKLGHKKKASLFQSYYKGILTTSLNPKVGLFFLTFLPQFTDAQRGNMPLQLLTLGICFVILGLITDVSYVYIFQYLKKNLFSKPAIQHWFHKITGIIFALLALKILFS